MTRPRCLILVVAYEAETTIESVIRRIPASLCELYELDVLVFDDASTDKTFELSHRLTAGTSLPFGFRTLVNPINQGYGGNQKLGYHYAIENSYDLVALLHGDAQYAPECLPELLEPVRTGQASAVLGSRMMIKGAARRGGMPLYKYLGNKILTTVQNKLLKTGLSEFHSGYRVYSVDALKAIPFDRNSNDFHFDTEILIQLLIAERKIAELPIPTYYGDEICYVNGIRYAWNVVVESVRAALQRLSLFYDPKYDCAPHPLSHYTPKFSYLSPHSFVLKQLKHATVLDLGCAGGYLGAELKNRNGCVVTGVDAYPLQAGGLDRFYIRDLNQGLAGIPVQEHEYVLLLDVIEHLNSPEGFLEELRERMSFNTAATLIISTGNVAFFITRAMLMLGLFNYGKRGILDLTHTRLFTRASMRRALEQAGFEIANVFAVPAPFPLAIGDNWLSRSLLAINAGLNKLLPGLFSYQMIFTAHARPTLRSLLAEAEEHARTRANSLAGVAQ